jgi:hypothetical protein
MLAASPGFTTVAVLSLAVGIGANCAIFSFADALVLRPLPVAQPGEVFTVGSTTAVEAFGASSIVSSYPDYVDIRDQSHSFDGLAGFTYVTAGFATARTATPKLKIGMLTSGNLFDVMRITPAIGRAFRPEENQVPGSSSGTSSGSRNSGRIPRRWAAASSSTATTSRSSALPPRRSLALVKSCAPTSSSRS